MLLNASKEFKNVLKVLARKKVIFLPKSSTFRSQFYLVLRLTTISSVEGSTFKIVKHIFKNFKRGK